MNIDRHITEVMEQVCELCVHPQLVAGQDELDDLCKACPAEAALKAALAAVENETAETFAKAIAGRRKAHDIHRHRPRGKRGAGDDKRRKRQDACPAL